MARLPDAASGHGAPVAVFVATSAEARPLLRALGAPRGRLREPDPTTAVEANGVTLVLARTGMGPSNAESSARDLLARVRAGAAVSIGLAAGLIPELQSGDLVVADRVVLHSDSSDGREFLCDRELRDRVLRLLRQTGHRHAVGPVVTVEQVLQTAAEKRRVATASGGIAADMESAGVAAAAASHAVPFLAIRAILDTAQEDLKIAFDEFLDSQGAPRPLRLIRHLIGRPGTLPALCLLGRRTRLLCTRLGYLMRTLCAP